MSGAERWSRERRAFYRDLGNLIERANADPAFDSGRGVFGSLRDAMREACPGAFEYWCENALWPWSIVDAVRS